MERKLKRKEIYERLNVTRYGYERLIEDGILDAPIRIKGRHPFHTESQVLRAEQRLYQKALPEKSSPATAVRKTRPLSLKMRTQIRNTANLRHTNRKPQKVAAS